VDYAIYCTFLLLGIRGGWQQIPMQESDCYFSKEQKINDVTVNTFWNFNASVVRSIANKTSNPYRYLSDRELKLVMQSTILKFYRTFGNRC
jgi:hypothetical protein